ncbi:MAG: hypothetical protein EOP09_00085 [Proteobacteria bacterium]|nr:MAG: hypothetical protein EOP09_00085 [Pseudomonadota bacterium]
MASYFRSAIVLRAWIALSISWIAICGFYALGSWQSWREAVGEYKTVNVNAFVERAWAKSSIASYPGAEIDTEGARDIAYDASEEAKAKFYSSLWLIVLGPLGIGLLIRISEWVVLGKDHPTNNDG